jgi:hypothetical protein
MVALALAGCATKPQGHAPAAIPPELVQDCQEPARAFKTNGELLRYSLDLRDALRACNRDKAALREWQEGQK